MAREQRSLFDLAAIGFLSFYIGGVLFCDIVCLCACMHACMSWLGLFVSVLFFCQIRWRISYFVGLLAGEVARAERMRIAHAYHVSETLCDLDDAQQIRRTRCRQPVRL